jgi:lauroyl/myristoyl acyltransferase
MKDHGKRVLVMIGKQAILTSKHFLAWANLTRFFTAAYPGHIARGVENVYMKWRMNHEILRSEV